MRIEALESTDILPCTEIRLLLNDGRLLADETFVGIGIVNDLVSLRKCALEALHRSSIVLGNELDDLARTFHSTADIIRDDVYRIVDLLNYSMEDFIKGNISAIYFQLVSESNVKGGIYRQLNAEESIAFGLPAENQEHFNTILRYENTEELIKLDNTKFDELKNSVPGSGSAKHNKKIGFLNFQQTRGKNMSDTKECMKTILLETVYEINPFHTVLIADPLYLQQLKSGSHKNHAGMKDLIADFTVPTQNHMARAHLRRVYLQWEDGIRFTLWELLFYSFLDSEEARVFPKMALENIYYPEDIEQMGELACDTARYRIVIDGKIKEIHNGGDGFYGNYYTYKNGAFSFAAVSFPDEFGDETDLVQSLFSGIKELK